MSATAATATPATTTAPAATAAAAAAPAADAKDSKAKPAAGAAELDDKKLFTAKFAKAAHEKFVLGLDKKTDTFEYYASEHLRMSAVYWGCMAMELMGSLHLMDKPAIIAFVLKCQHKNGGFGGNVGHDPHLLYTLSAVQILVMFDAVDKLDASKVVAYVKSLQRADGSFVGDAWGEIDTRFSYCALNCCALLGQLNAIDVKAATNFVAKCRNFDGGFGAVPGAESHAGQIFCCVGALAIGDALHLCDADVLGWWLCERQLPTGGLNGRPEKKQDVCYSCEDGGFADRPGNVADVFHCYFGIAGLSLLGFGDFTQIDPVFALPVSVCKRLNLPVRYTTK